MPLPHPMRELLALLAPVRCPGCDHPHDAAQPLCGACMPLLDLAPPVLGQERGVWRFQGPLADAVRRLKYHGRWDLAPALADALLAGLGSVPAVQSVCAVPLHPRRLRERGYNQSALLARSLARRLRVPLDLVCLRRVRDAPSQVGHSRAARQAQVRGAFEARGGPASTSVLVVDDVRTSGATLGEACRVLRDAGATQVLGLALAQAEWGGTTPA